MYHGSIKIRFYNITWKVSDICIKIDHPKFKILSWFLNQYCVTFEFCHSSSYGGKNNK